MKTITKFTCPAFAALALACFAVLSTAQAVSPPPDGGYPGGNTAEGDNALLNGSPPGSTIPPWVPMRLRDDTTGGYNVAVGDAALANNTTGNFNMAIGAEALINNTANFNLAIGFRVAFMNTTGNHLTGIGAAALRNNTTASYNTAIGADALRENTTGENNTAIGADALAKTSTATRTRLPVLKRFIATPAAGANTANGYQALRKNTNGHYNTAIGASAL